MSIQGKTIVFTGKISKPRHEFQRLVEEHGGINGLSVTRSTDYLVVGEKPGSKLFAATSLGITLVENPVNNAEELQAALEKRAALDDIGIDAILIMPDFVNNSSVGLGVILEFANEHKLPLGGGTGISADLGALFSFVPDFFETGMLAAPIADKIFKGTPVGTIPVVTSDSRLRLNYKVIQELGLEASEGLLSRASEIIR